MSNNKNFCGAIHLHTNLSHDGWLSLEQLVNFLKPKGYEFIAITEHSYDINDSSINDFAKQCERLSSPEFLIIPGIEFRCHDDIDILGYGVIQTCDSDDPATIIKHIQNCGGVAVLAHPTVQDYPFDSSWIKMLDGCELWNRQEGKFLPQVRSIKTFLRFKKWHPGLKAFFGLDLHRSAKFYYISTTVNSPKNAREDLLLSMKKGNFTSESAFLKADSSGNLGVIKMYYVYWASSILNFIRKMKGFLANEQ